MGDAPDRLLDAVGGPEDLRALAPDELPRLAAEIREFLVEHVTRTGGHLGPNLGVVELTIALHRVFDSPTDALVWDTGHQAYVHKLLTGRRDGFERLRARGGLSGYPRRAESQHDVVENSHCSTSLAYADGLAKAAELQGIARRVVAIIGDGALTGGMAWEALNNLGAARRPVVVVLNDNARSYAPTVGALARHLELLRRPGAAGAGETRTDRGEVVAAGGSADRPVANLFETLGLAYLGPVDGHDLAAVERALHQARDLAVPVVVHVVTAKGKGYPPAEADAADRLHAVPGARPVAAARESWTDVAAAELRRLGGERPDVVAVTAAMLRPTGLASLADAHPERVFDVGIAEQHAVTSAAGMAMGGLHPVVCVYATFLNRAFDQVLLDVALHRLPVTFLLDRAGVTGDDGPSHNGMWDLALLGIVPGLRVAAPRDGVSLRELVREAVGVDGPTAVRFPKGSVAADVPARSRLGSADVLRWGAFPGGGADVLVLAVGPLAVPALQAADQLQHDGLTVTVVDPRWLLPVDPELAAFAGRHRLVVTVEDGVVAGGFGDAVGRALRTAGGRAEHHALALGQRFLDHGARDALLREERLDADGIVAAVRLALGTAPLGTQPLGTQPLGTQPLGTQPLGTQPLSTQPPSTQGTLAPLRRGGQPAVRSQPNRRASAR